MLSYTKRKKKSLCYEKSFTNAKIAFKFTEIKEENSNFKAILKTMRKESYK